MFVISSEKIAQRDSNIYRALTEAAMQKQAALRLGGLSSEQKQTLINQWDMCQKLLFERGFISPYRRFFTGPVEYELFQSLVQKLLTLNPLAIGLSGSRLRKVTQTSDIDLLILAQEFPKHKTYDGPGLLFDLNFMRPNDAVYTLNTLPDVFYWFYQHQEVCTEFPGLQATLEKVRFTGTAS